MTDTENEDQTGEAATDTGADSETDTDTRDEADTGDGREADVGDETDTADGAGADAGADAAAEADAGAEAEAAGGAGGGEVPADPEERLQALQDDIDAVRRRVEEDTVDDGSEAFIQEGEASEDEPVDDTIAPPG